MSCIILTNIFLLLIIKYFINILFDVCLCYCNCNLLSWFIEYFFTILSLVIFLFYIVSWIIIFMSLLIPFVLILPYSFQTITFKMMICEILCIYAAICYWTPSSRLFLREDYCMPSVQVQLNCLWSLYLSKLCM